MIDLTNNSASVYKEISPERLFDKDYIEFYQIENVKWLMSIKPETRNVTKYIENRIRLEEIEVFSVKLPQLPDKGSDKKMMVQICKKVAYPCVVFIECGDKYKIATWKFIDSSNSANDNVLKEYCSTAWIHEPSYSKKADECVDSIKRLLLNGEGSIKNLYGELCSTISVFYPQYIASRHHLSLILYDLTGIKNHKVERLIGNFKKYSELNSYEKYQPKKYGKSYKYFYEYEDIWYAFMSDEEIKNTIQNRRYRDIEDLIFSIDAKYEETKDTYNGWI